jgi:uncharacterized repeat protein (TIGR03803 family)
MDPSSGEAVLHTFTGHPDGASPLAIIRDPAGNLYGITQSGGTSAKGTVFKVDVNGSETILHSFSGGEDGATPYGNLTLDEVGNIYGATALGGASGYGAVFKLDPVGHETVLYAFTGGADGANPYGGVVRDAAGNLYGTTENGGINPQRYCFGPCGVLFKLDMSGKETVLHSFTGPDGANPIASLTQDASGSFYGTTQWGGSGYGVVFKLDTSGKETVLYAFPGEGTDGANPRAGVIPDSAGNIYGTTSAGGAFACPWSGFGCGVVFKLTP